MTHISTGYIQLYQPSKFFMELNNLHESYLDDCKSFSVSYDNNVFELEASVYNKEKVEPFISCLVNSIQKYMTHGCTAVVKAVSIPDDTAVAVVVESDKQTRIDLDLVVDNALEETSCRLCQKKGETPNGNKRKQ